MTAGDFAFAESNIFEVGLFVELLRVKLNPAEELEALEPNTFEAAEGAAAAAWPV